MKYQLELLRSPGTSPKDDLNQSFVYVFRLTGNLILDCADEFNLLMNTLARGGMKKVVFDLSELKYVDSTGIGMFLQITKLVRAQGGDLVFLDANPKILEIFSLVKLNDFISFLISEKQVVDYFFPTK